MIKRIKIGVVEVRLFGGSMATGMKTWRGYLRETVICTAFYSRTLDVMQCTLIGDTANLSSTDLVDLGNCMKVIAAHCSEDPRAMAKIESTIPHYEVDIITN